VDPLGNVVQFGIKPPRAFPSLSLTSGEAAAAQTRLLTEAASRIENAEHLLRQIVATTPRRTRVEIASKALATIFGSGFVAVPRLLPPPAGEADLWRGALGAGGVRARPGAEIRPWLARMGSMRANASSYGATVLVREAFGRSPLLRVTQTPAGAYRTWAALP